MRRRGDDERRAVVDEPAGPGSALLVRTPILRSTLIVFAPVLFAFGLWNVLLLPFAIETLGGTEFQYGLQEGLTSLGFVVGSLLMAKYIDRLPEGTWMVISFTVDGHRRDPLRARRRTSGWRSSSSRSPASPSRRRRSRGRSSSSATRRASIRGRVFSAFFVSRDVLFLLGMAAAGLADVIDIRLLIVIASSILIGAAVLTQLMPGLGRPAAEWRRAIQLLRTAPDGGRRRGRRPPGDHRSTSTSWRCDCRRSPCSRSGAAATSSRRRRSARSSPGRRSSAQGDAGDAAYFILDGSVVAGTPNEDGSLPIARRRWATGDFFGEIAALTGSRRTANVVADQPTILLEVPGATLRGVMDVPALSSLFLSTLTERLTRTADAPTGRGWPATTRRRCATCGRRGRRSRRCRRPTERLRQPGGVRGGCAQLTVGRSRAASDGACRVA